MTIFFFVVGLEIKRELVAGELRERSKAMLPILAAIGGMVVPALFYLIVNLGGETQGWAIPMATDIAFAVGVLALLGPRVPPGLKVFVLTLAVADDIGAILVIAVFYSGELTPTLAGVALGLLTPAKPPSSVAERLERRLHPWTSFLIIPIFALANVGVYLGDIGEALGSRVTLGIVIGLVLGKLLGITGMSWLAVRLRIGALPEDMTWRHLIGGAAVAGIGFTVALFIAGLAFSDQALMDSAKIGVLVGSLLAGVAGACLLLSAKE